MGLSSPNNFHSAIWKFVFDAKIVIYKNTTY